MTNLLHPSDETLARHAAGSLAPGVSIVIDTHLASCPACRRAVRGFEAIGGAILEERDRAPPPADGLARALAAIERGAPPPPPAPPPAGRPELPTGFALPRALDICDFEPWRWLAPGVQISRARGDWARAADLKLLRAEPGRRLLSHGHDGAEWTCVLTGSFSDGRARFMPGDISEVDEDVDHQPVIDPAAPCICVVASEGRMKPHGMFGRFYQMVFKA